MSFNLFFFSIFGVIGYEIEFKTSFKFYFDAYTSFSEDLLYTSLLFKLKKLIIPHPFLNITKCSHKQLNKQLNNKENKYELIYIFLPL